MDTRLQKLCDDYIANRQEVEKAFKIENSAVYPICANIFLTHEQTADADRIKECKRHISEKTGVFNYFRGNMQAPAACVLACSSDPEEMMFQALETYKLLKEHFSSCEQLVLASLMLTELAEPSAMNDIAERAESIYKLMKEKHRFITDYRDSVFAVLLAMSECDNESIINDMEHCFTELKGMTDKNNIQTIAQIFAMSGKPVAEMCGRFKEVFEALRNSGIKYGKYHELPVLAALSITDKSIMQITQDISEVSEYLKDKKGYSGIFGHDKKTRYMHSAMLLTSYYSPSAVGSAAAAAVMLAIIAYEMMLMTVIIANNNI